MPNVKLYVDQRHIQAVQQGADPLLRDLRDMLCAALAVDHGACQMAVVPVTGLSDQPQINAELHVLPRETRTPAAMRQVAQDVRTLVAAATGQTVAVRIAMLDPVTYIALK